MQHPLIEEPPGSDDEQKDEPEHQEQVVGGTGIGGFTRPEAVVKQDIFQGGDEVAHQVAFHFDPPRVRRIDVLPEGQHPFAQHRHGKEEGGHKDRRPPAGWEKGESKRWSLPGCSSAR